MKVQWIHVMIDSPADQAEASARFWETAFGWQLGDPWRAHPEYRSFEPPGTGHSYIAFQTLGEGAPRVHLDVARRDAVLPVQACRRPDRPGGGRVEGRPPEPPRPDVHRLASGPPRRR